MPAKAVATAGAVERYQLPCPISHTERQAMCAWLRHHHIDPNDVPMFGWIERDETRRRVRYEAFVRNGQGNIVYDKALDAAAREVRVMQLEAAPSPFPQRR